jgi:uncharacterized membrane protein YeaQ/YmgE (transglycosylase-associated protein family)
MTLETILTWMAFGLIVGAVANLLDPNRNRMGIMGSVVLGIVGAVLGGLVAQLFGFSGPTGFNLYSFMVALLGSLIVLWVGRSLYPYQTYGPEYYDEDLTNDTLDEEPLYRSSPNEEVEVKTTTRKVRRNDNEF